MQLNALYYDAVLQDTPLSVDSPMIVSSPFAGRGLTRFHGENNRLT
jgi:hypothetical protein